MTKYFTLPFEIKRGDKFKMKSFIPSIIRLIISLGKFGIMFYTLSMVNIALNSSDNFRYLKNGSPILKLSAIYIQGEINSNIKRKQRQVLLEV